MDSVVRQRAVGDAAAQHRPARPAHPQPAAECGRSVSNRFSQLAYTSFDRPGGAGGWQIKQSSADLSPEETQRLVSGVRTAFRPVEPLPDYPTPQQLEAFPRRLAYRRWARRDGGGSGYWHTAPAGADSTGRPGNVFAHVLLDRAPDTAPRLRPIQRWRAPS